TNHCRGKPTRVSFNLSEDAQVRIANGAKTRATLAGHTGANTVKLSTRKLPPGRYTLAITATDAAGNASAPAHAKVTVKRR
ncbi:MAG: Internalin domain, partial [Thermoleophilaceae bacterium]|nr:Internalin domain [Thermoleophilaceae bacterium]